MSETATLCGPRGSSGASMPRFFFVRHGETEWNREGRLQGQMDVSLNGRGRDQAAAAGRILRHLSAERNLAAVDLDYVASPLRRTRATMELLRQAMDLPPHDFRIEDRLKEISFGSWEGMTWRQIEAADPTRYAERNRNKWTFAAPGGESYAEVADRVRPWLRTLADNAVVVAHGGVARALLTLIAGLDPRRAPSADIWQGRVLVFEDGQASWV